MVTAPPGISPDIVERLEHYAKLAMPHYPNDICSQAKREIERLRAAQCSAGNERPAAWLRDLQPEAEDEALVTCNKIDPGAFPVYRTLEPAQAEPEQMSFIEAMSLAERGMEIWKAKEHNKKWWRRIDGTPIPNDLLVNIADEFAKCGLVYASSVSSTNSDAGK